MKKNMLVGIMTALIITALTPITMNLGNGIFTIFTTPKELKETNKRIYTDSLIAIKQLKDSCYIFRGIIKNQNDRLSIVENKLFKIKIR